MNDWEWRLFGVSFALATSLGGALAESPLQSSAEPRSKPPVFTQQELAIFPKDPWALLEGDRPSFEAAEEGRPKAREEAASAGPDDGAGWHRWLSAEVYESEVKRQVSALQQATATPSEFKGGGYGRAHVALAVLSGMFAAASEHQDDLRWRDVAPTIRDALAQAGAACKTASDAAFRLVEQRAAGAGELIRGGRPTDLPAPRPDFDWGAAVGRAPLMLRMEECEKNLRPLLADARSFSRGSDEVLHEAQVLATLAQVVTIPGFEDASDSTYIDFAESLRDAAAEAASAAEAEDYPRAAKALSEIGRACNDCHESYRG